MKKIIFTVVALSSLLHQVNAQEKTKQDKGYFNITELGYFALKKNTEFQTESNPINTRNSAYGVSLRTINGYFITEKVSVGAGVGFEKYALNSFSTNDNFLPLFIDSRYYIKNDKQTFFYLHS